MNSNKNIILYGAAMFIATTVAIIISTFMIPSFNKIVNNWKYEELIIFFTAVSAISGVVATLPSIVTVFIFNRKSTYKIELSCNVVSNNTVIISSSIENVGGKRIYTKDACLIIDNGESENACGITSYRFPFLLKHDVREKHCELKRIYETRGCFEYPNQFINQCPNGVHRCIPLQLLSKDSVQYVSPKEKLSEDIALSFSKSGVYRVTLVVVAEGKTDCSCASKQFYISC